MTRASKQIRMMTRWRQQAARLLASIEIYGDGRTPTRSDSPSLGIMLATGGTEWEQWNSHALQIERGARFNVAKARAYAQHLVAMAGEQTVFEDWTRARALGPENLEPGAFGAVREGFITTVNCSGPGSYWFEICGMGIVVDVHAEESAADVAERLASAVRAKLPGWSVGVDGHMVRFWQPIEGGWPGKLASEYGWRRCDACEGRGRRCEEIGQGRLMTELWRGRVTFTGSTDGGATMLVRCNACKGRGRIRRHGRPPGIAVGRSLARVGQRLLDTLDGRCPWAPSAAAQSNYCHNPWCLGIAGKNVCECTACCGTGNNLAGALPPIEASPRIKAILRRMPADAAETMRRKLRLPVELTLNRFIESVASASAGEYERMRNVHITSDNGRALDQFAQAVLDTSAGEASRMRQVVPEADASGVAFTFRGQPSADEPPED